MNYKKNCITLAIIIIACGALLGIFNIKREYEHTKKIESILNFSNQEKSSLNYQNLIRDIKSLENGKGVKHAKNTAENEGSNNSENVKIVVESKEYQGEGYKIDIYNTGETSIYNIYKNDKCVYSVSENILEEHKKSKKVGTISIIIYVVIIICVILELIFLFKYKFSKSSVQADAKKQGTKIEHTNSVENGRDSDNGDKNIENK